MSATLDKIIEEVRQLPPNERQQLREKLNEIVEPTLSEDDREDVVEHYLAAKGIITLPASSAEDENDSDDDWEPVNATGVPVSEMIIRERR